jgi:Ran GTPase-activating protein (RanGAP) involved in mRNA processing and transport
MAEALSACISRIVGEEKTVAPPYSVLLRRIDAQATNSPDEPVDIILCGKHKDLFNCRINNEFVQLLVSSISELIDTGLKIGTLDLSCNNVDDESVELIADKLVGNIAINALKLRSNNITVKGCTALCESMQHMTSTGDGSDKSITYLDLNGNPLGEISCDTLCNMLRSNSSVVHLDLGNTEIGTMTLIQLAKVMWYNNTVRVLNLENPRIYDKEETTTYHLAKMVRANRSLAELYLGKHKIGDRGAQLLAEYLEDNATLRVLDLRCNKIGVAGAEAFAILLMRGGGVLATLNLASNRICDQGGQALGVALRSSRHLLSLDISSNSIGDMGLVAIADALNGNTTLQRLLIFGNNFGEQSSDALRELSETRFRYYDLEEKDFQSYIVDGKPYIAKVRPYADERKIAESDTSEI